jgi:hypothetical protein
MFSTSQGNAGTGTTTHYGCGVPSIVTAIVTGGNTPITIPTSSLQAAAAAVDTSSRSSATRAPRTRFSRGLSAGSAPARRTATTRISIRVRRWCDWIGWDPYDHTPPQAPGGRGQRQRKQILADVQPKQRLVRRAEQRPVRDGLDCVTHTYAVNAIAVPTVYIERAFLQGRRPPQEHRPARNRHGRPPPVRTVVDGSVVTWTEQGLSSGGKPRMLGEVGCQYRSNGTRASGVLQRPRERADEHTRR